VVIRMREVAEKAGVSVTTVSHLLNKTRHVAPKRAGVLEAVRRLNDYKRCVRSPVGARLPRLLESDGL